ncbi:hypothetical protein E4U21_001100 [Claviceps maximensis]|nr:hypothetical protein E4U21_001100 [Claviceps maximensis]
MTLGPANVGDTGFENKGSKNKHPDPSLSKREAAASSTCRHTSIPNEGYQDASHHGPETAALKVSRLTISEQRARKLGERYGAVMESTDLVNMAPTETVHRVDKPIRMRPSKESEADSSANLEGMETEAVVKADRENSAILADLFWGDHQIELKRPSKTGGQDLIHRKPRQRDKYPFGYPGDVFGPQTEPRFECLSCKTLYPLEAKDGTPCHSCGLEKSGESLRTIPRKIQPMPDPDVLFRLQATLAGLVSSSSK